MEFNNIDDLLAQLDCKIPEGDVADDVAAEYTDNEEYVNFVMQEIIKGNASLDATESTPVTSASTPPSEIYQHQDTNPGVGSAVVNPGPISGLQPNMYPVTASYISNGKPVVMFANTVATSTASAQTLTAVAASAAQSKDSSSGPCASALMEGNRVGLQSAIGQQSQKMIIVAQPPILSQPREASAAAPLTNNANNYILTNAFVTPLHNAQNPPVAQGHGSSPVAALVPASEAASVTSTPDSENKKRKLYEEAEFKDPVMEKRRRNAQNAKNHRDKTKLRIQELSGELEQTRKEKEKFQTENEELRLQVAQQEEVKREIQALRQENERLRAREQAWAQQEKFGLMDFDLSDLLK